MKKLKQFNLLLTFTAVFFACGDKKNLVPQDDIGTYTASKEMTFAECAEKLPEKIFSYDEKYVRSPVAFDDDRIVTLQAVVGSFPEHLRKAFCSVDILEFDSRIPGIGVNLKESGLSQVSLSISSDLFEVDPVDDLGSVISLYFQKNLIVEGRGRWTVDRSLPYMTPLNDNFDYPQLTYALLHQLSQIFGGLNPADIGEEFYQISWGAKTGSIVSTPRLRDKICLKEAGGFVYPCTEVTSIAVEEATSYLKDIVGAGFVSVNAIRGQDMDYAGTLAFMALVDHFDFNPEYILPESGEVINLREEFTRGVLKEKADYLNTVLENSPKYKHTFID